MVRRVLVFCLCVLSVGSWSQINGNLISADSTIDYSIVDTTKKIKGIKHVENLSAVLSSNQSLPANEDEVAGDVKISIEFDLPNGGQASEILVEVSCGIGKNKYCIESYAYSDLVKSGQAQAKHITLTEIKVPGAGNYIVHVTLQYPNKIQGPTITKSFAL